MRVNKQSNIYDLKLFSLIKKILFTTSSSIAFAIEDISPKIKPSGLKKNMLISTVEADKILIELN